MYITEMDDVINNTTLKKTKKKKNRWGFATFNMFYENGCLKIDLRYNIYFD